MPTNIYIHCNHRLTKDTRVLQKSTKTFCKNQLTLWNLQRKIFRTTVLDNVGEQRDTAIGKKVFLFLYTHTHTHLHTRSYLYCLHRKSNRVS